MTMQIKCRSCGKPINVEERWIQASHRRGQRYFAWCGRQCQLRYVSVQGTAAVIKALKKKELEYARHHHSGTRP